MPVGGVGEETLRDLLPVIGPAFHRVVELGPGIAIPPSAYDPARRQHRSTVLLDALVAARRPGWERLLGIADVDLYVPRLNFVFGEADAARGVAIFSLARLHDAPDSEGRARFLHRATIEAVHELGHTWGLGHSHDPMCVMWFSNTWPRPTASAPTDDAGVDVVHGHSSHHPKGIEAYHGKLVLYGCGDLLTDYEGIEGHEEFRGGLGLMYFAEIDGRGDLAGMTMTPTRLERLRLNRASTCEAQWLAEIIDRESRPRGAKVELRSDGRLHLVRA